jgi:cysteinyl-tRNA synthetase
MPTIREIRLTNTLTGKKELLVTRVPGKLSFYSCGPTVYGLIHIGNLRGGLVADMAYRYFQRVGYEVNYVRNYTDVEDKIIRRAREEGLTPEQLTEKYIAEVEKDYALAGMAQPTQKPRVTGHMAEIVAMIEKIVARGHGYVAPDGEVLFSIESFEDYGKLSHKPLEDLIAGSRVEVSAKKRNPLDFTLWKPAKPGEPAWESPWGPGRPGWHIECSAMASRWLGDQIDVHHGGEDLVFPHHENEIAQSEAACGKAPFVRTWIHHAFLTIAREKMSKSLGNVFTARDFLSRFGGELARYLLLSVHYRSPIDFDEALVEHALQALQRLYEAKRRAVELASLKKAMPDPRAEAAWGSFLAEVEATRRAIDDHYANDFNTAGVLGEVFSLIRSFNRTLAEPLAGATPASVLGARELLSVIEEDLGGVLGVGRREPEGFLRELGRIRRELSASDTAPLAGGQDASAVEKTEQEASAKIEGLIAARGQARAAKNFAEADRLRRELDSLGVVLEDGPRGTTWRYR